MDYFKHDKAIVEDGARIGKATRIWAFTNIQNGAAIGAHCNICDGCFVEKGAVIGDHVTVKHHVAVFDGVTLEDDVFVGSNVAFINDRHPRSHRQDDWTLEKTTVKKSTSLGSNSVILCGLTVGAYAVVGAGAVVTRDVPPHAIITGNPGVITGHACRCGLRLNDNLKCSCGAQYTKEDLA